MADTKEGNKGNFAKGNSNNGEKIPENKKWEKGDKKYGFMKKIKK
jgi:hypothetical protein